MAPADHERGRASGWTVDEDPDGGFRWSAYGPEGGRRGHAESQAEAEAVARRAEQELRRPRPERA